MLGLSLRKSLVRSHDVEVSSAPRQEWQNKFSFKAGHFKFRAEYV